MPESPPKNTGAFAPFEWMIAARYLRAKRQESFISVISLFSLIGIALGVATLIIVMSVMNGFKVELLKSILGLSGHVTIQSQMGPLADFDRVAGRIKAVPGVVRVTPVIDGQVLASLNNANAGVIVRGIRQSDLAKTPVAEKLRAGSLAYSDRDDVVMVGAGLAAKLGVQVGGDITLISPKGEVTPFGTTLRTKTYHVISTFRVGNTLYDSNYIFMPLNEAQLYFNYGDAVGGIEVTLTDADADIAMLPALIKAAGPATRAVPWQAINSAFFEAIEVEKNVMFLILSLIILVAALNIISGLIMLVKDKSPDIAILRTMGATRGAVMRVFFIAGASIGVVGTLLGFVIGVAFCANIENIRQFLSKLTGTPLFDPTIYFLSRMPAELAPGQVAAVVIDIFHVRPEYFGFTFVINGIGLVIFSQSAAWWLKHHPGEPLFYGSLVINAVAGLALVGFAFLGWGGLIALLPFTLVYCAMIGPINATAAGLAMRDFGHAAGMASALAGILLYGGGTLASIAMGSFPTPSTPMPLTGLMALFGFLGLATYLLFRPGKSG